MSTLSARQTILLVVLFVATSVAFIVLDNRRALDPLRTGVQDLLVPITNLAGSIDDPSRGQTDLEARYAELQAKYDRLLADYTKLMVNAQEVEELRAILDLETSQPNLVYVPARVLWTDPTHTQKFVTIDKGSADGIREGMAVTDPNFYVGLVTEVYEHQARVTFAIDSTQSVGAQMLSSSAVGIAWGMWQRGGRMELRHVERSIQPQEGEYIVTACATEASTAQVPCGLIIGIVAGPPVIDNQGDTQTIPILPGARFDELTVVAVIIADTNAGP